MKKNDSNIKKAVNYLNNNECIAIPTETVYGLAGNAYSDKAVSRIYKLNSVENSGSFTWHGYNVSMVRKVDNAGLYQMARDFYNSLKNSQQKAAAVTQEESNY